jgi:deazaflavin-dependent oxidoreductase (nitroreductase family)
MSTSFGDFNRNLVADLRANGGEATSGPFKGRPLLILTTKGAKTGATRVNPLVYSKDGDKLVIVASKGGAPTHPSWYLNLAQHPEVLVEAGGETFKAKAHITEGAEYDRLFKNHADINPGFYDYRKKTTRKMPVVALERIGPA